MQLTRKRIIVTAMDLIEREGVEAVSMGRVAAELGCGVMSLYNLVPSHSALLDGIAEEVLVGIEITTAATADWPEHVRAQARVCRQMARAHPRCAMVVASRPPSSASILRPVESALATLRDAGFTGPDAVRIVRTFAAHILGSILRDVGVAPGLDAGDRPRLNLRAGEFPQLTSMTAEFASADPDADFEFGLDLLVHAVSALRRAQLAR